MSLVCRHGVAASRRVAKSGVIGGARERQNPTWVGKQRIPRRLRQRKPTQVGKRSVSTPTRSLNPTWVGKQRIPRRLRQRKPLTCPHHQSGRLEHGAPGARAARSNQMSPLDVTPVTEGRGFVASAVKQSDVATRCQVGRTPQSSGDFRLLQRHGQPVAAGGTVPNRSAQIVRVPHQLIAQPAIRMTSDQGQHPSTTSMTRTPRCPPGCVRTLVVREGSAALPSHMVRPAEADSCRETV